MQPADQRVCSRAITAARLLDRSMRPARVFFRALPVEYCDTPLLAPRGSLTVVPPDHEGTLDALLAMFEPGEEVFPIDPKDACEMVPFLRPDHVARALAALTADLCTAASTARTDRLAKALSPHQLL